MQLYESVLLRKLIGKIPWENDIGVHGMDAASILVPGRPAWCMVQGIQDA